MAKATNNRGRKALPELPRKKSRSISKHNEANEPRVHRKDKSNDVDIVLWFSKNGPESIVSELEVIYRAEAGVSRASVDRLAARIGISKKTMAEEILSMSVRTVERKAPSETLDKKTSSHVIEVARVVHHAYEVFEDDKKVKLWLMLANPALNYLKPIELLDSLSGLNLVNDVLGRIEEGVYS